MQVDIVNDMQLSSSTTTTLQPPTGIKNILSPAYIYLRLRLYTPPKPNSLNVCL